MITFSDSFNSYNSSPTKEPLFVVQISFDTAFSVLEYFTSSASADTPGGASVTDSVVKDIGGSSQRVDPFRFISSIGNLNFELLDKDGAVTALFNTHLDSGYGLREKRVRVYMGYVGMDWADYALLTTQIINNVKYVGGMYKIQCSDIQRIIKKEIFTAAETNIQSTVPLPISTRLNGALTDSATTITVDSAAAFASSGAIIIGSEIITYSGKTTTTFTGCTRGTNYTSAAAHSDNDLVSVTLYTVTVYDTTDFAMCEHDDNYTDVPNQTVGYFKIDEEIFRYTGKTSTTFTNCVRGVLNTKPAEHAVNTGDSYDKRPKVEEYVYIETTAVKILYFILLGAWYNNPTSATGPSNWSLEVDPIWVRNADLTGIGFDIWDNSVYNVNTGLILRFSGEKKQDGKKFIEEQLLPCIGAYMPIYAEGDLGLKRTTVVLDAAPYIEVLDTSNIRRDSIIELNYNQEAVANQFIVNWSWSELKNSTSRKTTFIDSNSISTHQDAQPIEITLRGLHGSIHTQSTVKRIIQRLRDRYAAPPIETSLNVLPSLNYIESGDIVKVSYNKIRDYTADAETLDRSFEVQQRNINWVTGELNFSLFGSSAKPGVSVLADETTVISSATYTALGAAGTLVSTLSGYSAGHLTTNVTMAGGNTLQDAIWYHDGDLTIDTGVTITINNNVWLVVKGEIIVNGKIDGAGQGSAGAVSTVPDIEAGTANLLEAPRPDGYISLLYGYYSGTVSILEPSGVGISADKFADVRNLGTTYAIPEYNIEYDGTLINWMPTNLMGSSGYTGGGIYGIVANAIGGLTYYIKSTALGEDGGAAGAGLCTLSRGVSFGVNGEIDLSGADGVTSTTQVTYINGAYRFLTSSGGPGAPGCWLCLLDGSTATIPETDGHFVANTGISATDGTALTGANISVSNLSQYVAPDYTKYYARKYAPTTPIDLSKVAHRIQFITDNLDEGDVELDYLPSTPTGLAASSTTAELLTQSDGTVVSRILLTWTATQDKYVDGYLVKYKNILNDNDWSYLPFISRDLTAAYIYPVIDGDDYDIEMSTINIFGKEGPTTYLPHTVTGKTSAPNDPTSVTLTAIEGGVQINWTNPTDKDLQSIAIFADTTSPTDPADLYATISSGRPGTNQKYVIKLAPGTTQYVKIKAIDSTGNEGNLVATTPTNVDALVYAVDWVGGVLNIPEQYIYNIDVSSVLGYNPAFSKWDGDYPTGWDGWTGSLHSKETTTVLMGMHSVGFSPVGGTNEFLYLNDTVVFQYSLSEGDYLLVTFSYYLAAITGSGRPGVALDLYSNYLDTRYAEVASAVVGEWHQQTFAARVREGETLKGLSLYLVGSWDEMPNGQSNCTVYFDNVNLKLISAESLAFNDGSLLESLKPTEAGSDKTSNHIAETWSSDLVIDGDMEALTTTYWSEELPSSASLTVTKDGTEYYYGTQSLKFQLTVASPRWVQQTSVNGYRIYIPCEENDTFEVRAWAKVTTGTINVGLSWYDDTYTYVSSSAASHSTSTWTKISGTLTAPATARYCVVHIASAGNTTAYVDAIRIIRTN